MGRNSVERAILPQVAQNEARSQAETGAAVVLPGLLRRPHFLRPLLALRVCLSPLLFANFFATCGFARSCERQPRLFQAIPYKIIVDENRLRVRGAV